jgi:hypothetical protein
MTNKKLQKVAKSCKKLQKVADVFVCLNCDYSTCPNSSYDKHLATDKYYRLINTNYG